MPETNLAYWKAQVRRHSESAGHTLSSSVIDELAMHLVEVGDEVRERGGSDADALQATCAALEAARYDEVAGCQRAGSRFDSGLVAPGGSAKTWLGGLDADVRDAIRHLRQQPAFAATVAVILALGIGASTAAYVVLDAVVLRPLPYTDPGRLVVVSQVTDRGEGRAFAAADWRDYQTRNAGLLELAAFASWPMNLTGGGAPERLRSVIVSGGFFRVAGQQARFGRVIIDADDDPAAARVVVLSDGFWKRRFGSDRSAIGAEIVLNGRPATVVGVMPPSFALPAGDVDLWMPMAVPAAVLEDRAGEWVSLIGRLSAADVVTAQAALTTTASALEQSYPRTNAGERPHVRPLADDLVRDARRPIWLGVVAALLVLLTSCGNVAHLIIVRASQRREEMAIRAGLGAAPWRLRRQLLVESGLLTLGGGLVGAAIAAAFLRGFAQLGSGKVPRLDELSLSPGPMVAAAAASMAVAVAVAAIAHRFVVRAALSGSAPASSRVIGRDDGAWLLAGQVAFAVTLSTATALVVGSAVATARIDAGFDTTDTLTAQLTLPRDRYPDSDAHVRFAARLSTELAALPGVTSVGIVSDLPFVANALHFPVGVEGAAADQQMTVRPADPGFFRTLRIPVLDGRTFTADDRAGAPLVAIVNRTGAERLRAAANAGLRLHIAGEPPRAIVGVVGDIRHAGLHADEGPVVYVPYAQKRLEFLNWIGVVLRGPGVERLGLALRLAVQQVDADQPVQAVRPMADYVARERAPFELSALVVGTLTGAAVLLALAGSYAMTAFIVARRRREWGLRLALGASRGSIVTLVLRRAGLPIVTGTVLGVAGSAMAAGLLRSVVAAAVAPATLPLVAIVAAILPVAGIGAALYPAWRATRVDPRTSLSIT